MRFDSDELWASIRKKGVFDGLKILFIGDSLTYYNDMPTIFSELSRAAGLAVTVDALTKGGMGVAMRRESCEHWQLTRDKIASESWDIVVFQPNRNQPTLPEFFPGYAEKELRAIQDLIALIEKAGAVPLQYCSFGVTKGYIKKDGQTVYLSRLEHTDRIIAYNTEVRKRLTCKAVYVGRVFNKVTEKFPDIDLYGPDKVHPSLSGSYLAAAAFYTVIFGETPPVAVCQDELDGDLTSLLTNACGELLRYDPLRMAHPENAEKSPWKI